MITSSWLRVVLVVRRVSSALEVRTLGRKCKVRVKQLAVFAGSILIKHFPKKGKSSGTTKASAGITIYHSRLQRVWFEKASQAAAARITASQPQSQKHISRWREDVRLHIAAKPLLIPALSIYHSAENVPLHPMALLSRAWFTALRPEPHQTCDVFITVTFHRHHFCLSLKRGGEKRLDGWEKGERTGERGWTKRAGFHLSIHQRGDAALQISWSSFVMFSACQWP